MEGRRYVHTFPSTPPLLHLPSTDGVLLPSVAIGCGAAVETLLRKWT